MPVFLRRIPVLDEQNLPMRRVAGHEDEDRALLGNPGQVVEVAVLSVLVVDIERIPLHGRAPQDEHRVRAQALHDAGAPGSEVSGKIARVGECRADECREDERSTTEDTVDTEVQSYED